MKEVDIVSKIVNREGGTFVPSSKGTQSIDLSDYLLKSIWDKVFEIRTDSQGTEYLFGKLPVVTQYGITMYSGDGVDIPSLASGLPFDGRTIWYNPDTQQIEVIGGTGGGSGEGVSNFWDLSGIPSWITISKPKYTYSEIEGTPDLGNYALRSDVTLVSEKLNDFLEGSDTDNIINKWKELEVFLNGLSESDNLATILSSKVGKDYVDGNFVTLSTPQSILAEKDFVGGLKVNGSPIYYDTEKKYWKLEGDLLVTGGVTMYGNEGTFTPSTIMDAILYDDATLGINSNGQLYVKGGTSGGGLDITALQNYLTQNSYLNVTSGDNRYLQLSGGTISGASGNYTPLIVETKSLPEVWLNFKDTVGNTYIGSDKGQLAVYIEGDRNYLLLHSGNYSNYALPLSGGTIYKESESYPITLRSNTEVTGMKFTTSEAGAWILYGGGTNWRVTNNGFSNSFNIWHSGNDGSGSGLDADLLDGKQPSDLNVASADMLAKTWKEDPNYTVTSNSVKIISNTKGTAGNYATGYSSGLSVISDYVGWQLMSDGGDIENPYFRRIQDTNVWRPWRQLAFIDDNVASATKLQTARTIWGQSFDGTGNVDGIIKMTSADQINGTLGLSLNYDCGTKVGTNIWDGQGGITIRCTPSGNVGIGTAIPSCKLDVNGEVCSLAYRTYGDYGIWRGTHFTGALTVNDIAYHANIHSFWGNVGIGTTSPTTKLDVHGALKIFDYIDVREYNTKNRVTTYVYSGIGRLYSYNDDTGYNDLYVGQNSTNAIVVKANGNVGIGTASPAYKLDVNGTFGASSAVFNGENGIKITYDLIERTLSGSTLYMQYHHNGHINMCYGGGNVGIGTTSPSCKLHVSGDILATGAMTFYSMRKLKNVVNERGLSLSELSVIKPTRYTWKDGRDNRLHFGGIADDIQQVLPEVVYSTSDGILTMDYGNAAFAVASSLIKPVVNHEKRIAMLEEENKELRQEIERLKSA